MPFVGDYIRATRHAQLNIVQRNCMQKQHGNSSRDGGICEGQKRCFHHVKLSELSQSFGYLANRHRRLGLAEVQLELDLSSGAS